MEDAFTIKTTNFEGPLDLLLSLIQDRKLYINEISLAQVTDEYLAYVQRFQELPMGETAQFILVASTLLLIKSRSLLPDLHITEEEAESIEDLERRLKYYRVIKESTQKLRAQWGTQPLYYSGYQIEQVITFSPGTATAGDVANAAKQLLSNLPSTAFHPTAYVEATISLEEMIGRLEQRVLSAARVRFSDLSSGSSKVDRIVQFLAVLELVRGGLILAEQTRAFDDIVLESEGVTTPRYTV